MNALYISVKSILDTARTNAFRAVNTAMVDAYWHIGRTIVDEEQQGQHRAEYGVGLLNYLAQRLTDDFGKGFDESNLHYMRLFYHAFPIRDALRPELSWTHHRPLSKIDNENARLWYMNEAAAQNWSSRALDRQISTLSYDRLVATRDADRPAVEAEAQQKTVPLQLQPKDILNFASRYKLFLPTEIELKTNWNGKNF